MTAVSKKTDAPIFGSTLKTDALAGGVVFLLALTVAQRLTGFLRSVLFCRFLDDDELGQWSLAFSFLLLVAPLAVLGIPGSFGRYLEHFRQRGQMRSFLRRTSLAASVLAIVTLLLAWLGREWIAAAVFNDESLAGFVGVMCVALVAVITYNFLTELLTALRQVRVVSFMHFGSSMLFAAAGLALIGLTDLGAEGIVIAYAAGCAVVCLPALLVLHRCWRQTPEAADLSPGKSMWLKLLPFSAWVWTINLLANLFDAVDRWMIVKFAPVDATSAQALVGQYHSSRVVPVLLISVAAMLASVVLPYLSADWESGHKQVVARRLNLALKLIALTFTAAGVAILFCAPLLFGWALGGRYDDGLAVLPWTLTYCVWFSLGLMAQNYLWCAERAKLSSLAFLIGLISNLVLNMLLLPRFGLLGAVWATAAANAVALALIYALSRRSGMRLSRGVWLASCLPLILTCGPVPALTVLLLVTLFLGRSQLIFDVNEKREFVEWLARYRSKLPLTFISARRKVREA